MAQCAVLAGPTISISQALSYGQAAGFSGNSLTTIVAVAMSESSLYTNAINQCDPYGGSYGILQINGSHFGHTFGPNGQYTMSQATAFNPQLSFIYAYELSGNGANFTPWGSYTNGSYLGNMSAVANAEKGQSPVAQGMTFPPYTGQPWYDFPNEHNFGIGTEHGTDLAVPPDTPVTAILPGTISNLAYYDWGGQITWKVDNPSLAHGYPYEYVIHLDAINPNLGVGQHIDAGEFLGYSGGELSAQGMPALPAGLTHHPVTNPPGVIYSTGPHEEIGLASGPAYGFGSGYTLTTDPSFLISMAQAEHLAYGTSDAGSGGGSLGGQPPPTTGFTGPTLPLGFNTSALGATSYNNLGTQVHNTLVQHPGFYGIALALDEAEQFPGFYNALGPQDVLPWNIPQDVLSSIVGTIVGNVMPLVIRSVLILMGLFLILALFWQLVKPAVEQLPQLIGLAALAAAA